jgi:hypothetical protein
MGTATRAVGEVDTASAVEVNVYKCQPIDG